MTTSRREPVGASGEVGAMTAPAWLGLDARHVWHPYTQMRTAPPPLAVVRAEGAWLHLADGRRVLDGISSWWVNVHGHAHPRLVAALRAQAGTLEQVIFAGAAHEPAARLAAELAAVAPGELPHVFFSDDGSTAVEVALKMAWQLWRNRGEPRRRTFVALAHAYHGDTFGAMAASGVAAFHRHFADLLFHVERVRVPGEASADAPGDVTASPLPTLEQVLARRGDEVAAVIVEPMLQGAGGMRLWPPEALREVRERTRRHAIPLIADEVFTGFGRTGRLFACQHADVAPDILCLSKALTGGMLPLGATLATREVYDAFLADDRGRALLHGHSYTGNALACAVGRASLALLRDGNALARVARLETLYRERLARLASHPRVARPRCLGGMAAFDVRGEGGDRADDGYFAEIGPRLAAAFVARGVLLRPLGNVVYVLPPYVVTDDEVHLVFDVIEDVLAHVL